MKCLVEVSEKKSILSFLGFGDIKIWVLNSRHCWEKPKADDSLQMFSETGANPEKKTEI